jgi:hypothetical protein
MISQSLRLISKERHLSVRNDGFQLHPQHLQNKLSSSITEIKIAIAGRQMLPRDLLSPLSLRPFLTLRRTPLVSVRTAHFRSGAAIDVLRFGGWNLHGMDR